ncbi:hypothetical protein PLESTB_001168400 [Pleodorina starrii]|uniref:Uncharacterized protein n=1 Tax=Pleodorina starrii TaxID=330485 RepID=A0A9W6BS56_9CHLO|nr:hypothetical protein PLESTB_001168400 [Pleodorina starrii]GLC64799.1 hypothetical protein PLESTF_000208700 [Pleodorina starrii]
MRQMAAASSVKEQRAAVDSALSLQLWRATGLAPKALQCPRHVFSSEPDCEPSTSGPPVDSFVFRVPQLPQSTQCFYNGPVDTLPTYGDQGLRLSRRPSRATAPPPPPAPVLPYTGKQPRSKPANTAKGGYSATTSQAAATTSWYDPPDCEEVDPLGNLLSQCQRRQRTSRSRRPRHELALVWCDKPTTVSLLRAAGQAAGKGGKTLSLPLRQGSQQLLQAHGLEVLNAGGSSGGGSVSSGTNSFGAVALDAKGQPLSPSSPLSEWRG